MREERPQGLGIPGHLSVRAWKHGLSPALQTPGTHPSPVSLHADPRPVHAHLSSYPAWTPGPLHPPSAVACAPNWGCSNLGVRQATGKACALGAMARA